MFNCHMAVLNLGVYRRGGGGAIDADFCIFKNNIHFSVLENKSIKKIDYKYIYIYILGFRT